MPINGYYKNSFLKVHSENIRRVSSLKLAMSRCPGEVGRSPGRGLHSVVQSPILCIVTRSAGGKLPPAVGEFAPISVRTDNKLMEEQNCCSQGGRGETRPALRSTTDTISSSSCCDLRLVMTLELFNFTLIQTVMNMHKQTSCFCLDLQF